MSQNSSFVSITSLSPFNFVGDFEAGACGESWDRLVIKLTQPFRRTHQFGLSLLRVTGNTQGESQGTASVPEPQASTKVHSNSDITTYTSLGFCIIDSNVEFPVSPQQHCIYLHPKKVSFSKKVTFSKPFKHKILLVEKIIWSVSCSYSFHLCQAEALAT